MNNTNEYFFLINLNNGILYLEDKSSEYTNAYWFTRIPKYLIVVSNFILSIL